MQVIGFQGFSLRFRLQGCRVSGQVLRVRNVSAQMPHHCRQVHLAAVVVLASSHVRQLIWHNLLTYLSAYPPTYLPTYLLTYLLTDTHTHTHMETNSHTHVSQSKVAGEIWMHSEPRGEADVLEKRLNEPWEVATVGCPFILTVLHADFRTPD